MFNLFSFIIKMKSLRANPDFSLPPLLLAVAFGFLFSVVSVCSGCLSAPRSGALVQTSTRHSAI
jgi:hypothetical protein